MMVNFSYEKIYNFASELNANISSGNQNIDFRYNSLLLIKKHFGFERASFILFQEQTGSEGKVQKNFADNATIGISNAVLEEYYETYYQLDPLNQVIPQEKEVIRLSDIISKKELVQTAFYREFYQKYGYCYHVTTSIWYEDTLIANLSFFRKESEHDFTKLEMQYLLCIRDIIGSELLKCLHYERVMMENLALQSFTNTFPIGQLMLDNNYNVIYANEQADIYCRELTGKDASYFKHYYVSEVLAKKHESSTVVDGDTLVIDNFFMKIMKEENHHHLTNVAPRFSYVVYLMKNYKVMKSVEERKQRFKFLTKREKEIIVLIEKGYTNAQIADELYISPNTVKTHLQRMYTKYNVSNRTQLLYLLLDTKLQK